MWPGLAFLVLCVDEQRGRAGGERGSGRRVRRLGCQRGMGERGDWHLHVHEAGQCQDSLMSPQAAISRSCSDCSDGLVWWLGHQLSLSCSAMFAVVGKEENGGGKDTLQLHTHARTQIRDRKGRETALAPGYWFCFVTLAHFPLSALLCFSTFPVWLQHFSVKELWTKSGRA